MNKIILNTLLGATGTLCLMAQPAIADIKVDTLISGPYVSIQGGIGGMDTKQFDEDGIPAGVTLKEELRDGVSGRISGGYLWTNNPAVYGVEVGFSVYPKNKYTLAGIITGETEYSGNTADLLAVGKYYFSKNWNILGKLGAAYVNQKAEGKSEGIVFASVKKHKVLPEIAVGIGYDFNSNFGMDLSFSHIHGISQPNNPNDIASINFMMLGLTYHFA